MNPHFLTEAVIVLLGAVGGFIRIVFTGGRSFRKVVLPNNEGVIFYFGWIGDITVGAVAAYIVWATGLGNPTPPVSYALAIISGLTGSSILNSFVANKMRKYVESALHEEVTSRNEMQHPS